MRPCAGRSYGDRRHHDGSARPSRPLAPAVDPAAPPRAPRTAGLGRRRARGVLLVWVGWCTVWESCAAEEFTLAFLRQQDLSAHLQQAPRMLGADLQLAC